MLRIKTEKNVSVYLREKNYGDYDGRSWGPAVPFGTTLDGAYGFNYLPAVGLDNCGYTNTLMEIQNVATTAYHLPYFPSMEEYRYDVQSSDVAYTGDGADYALYFYDYTGYGENIKDNLSPYTEAEAAYREHVYSHYLTIDEDTKTYMDGIIAANRFDKNNRNIISDVATFIQGSATYNLRYNRELDSESNIVIAFLDTYREGICQHYASAATMLFRALGIPARYTVGFVGQGVEGEWSDVTNKQAHAWVEVYIDGAGWFPVEVTGPDNSGGGDGGGGGSGGGGGGGGDGPKPELRIRPAPVYMQYDWNNPNAVLRPGDEILGLETLLEKGYTYEVVVSGERSLPGISWSRIESFTLYNERHVDVTANFDIIKSSGKIHVYMTELFVTTGSGSKVYDGTALVNDECSLLGDLLARHEISVFECTGSLTGVGRNSNTCTLIIVDENGQNVTDYYKINTTYGILQVTPRLLHIKANSAQKAYDGTPLTDSGYTVEGDIVEGELLEVTVIGSQTSVGRSDNAIADIQITNASGKSTLSNYKITYEQGKLSVYPPGN